MPFWYRGLVILRGHQVLTVSTPTGYTGLPKGKPNKVHLPGNIKEWRWETPEETALRETKEETGLEPSTLRVLAGQELREYNGRENLSVSYFPALYVGEREPIFRCDPDELARVSFRDLEIVAEEESFPPQRQALIAKAAELLAAASEADFVPGDGWVARPRQEPVLHYFRGLTATTSKVGCKLLEILHRDPEKYGL